MRFRNVVKIYRYDFVILWLSCAIFAVSCCLTVKAFKDYSYNKRYFKLLSMQEYKIVRIKNVLSKLRRYQVFFDSSIYVVNIDKRFKISPFDELIFDISSIYDSPGFFFLDFFYLQTCLDNDKQESSRCIPFVEIKGEKYLTYHDPKK